jgi:hypothetical protein
MLDAAIKSGKVTQAQVKECVDAYCKQASCALPSQTGTSNVLDQPAAVEANAQPVPTRPPPIISLVRPETPRVGVIEEAAPAKKSNALWWLVALIGGGLIIKKLAAVKVVGAAVAGVPLIAEMTPDEDDEEEEGHEEPETDSHSPPASPEHLSGPPEAHQIED